jgi:hypothetical protein
MAQFFERILVFGCELVSFFFKFARKQALGDPTPRAVFFNLSGFNSPPLGAA